MRETRRNEEEELARQGKWTKEREEVGAGRERKVGRLGLGSGLGGVVVVGKQQVCLCVVVGAGGRPGTGAHVEW